MKFAWLRKSPSFVETPFGRHPITGLFGLSGRNWFIGLHTFGERQRPVTDRWMAAETAKLEWQARERAAAFYSSEKLVRVVDTGPPIEVRVQPGDKAKVGDRTYTANSIHTGSDGERRVSCSFESTNHYGDASLSEVAFIDAMERPL